MILEERFKKLRDEGVNADELLKTLITQPIYDTNLNDGRIVIVDASDRVNLKITEQETGKVLVERQLLGMELFLLEEAVRCYLGTMTAEGLLIRKEREINDIATQCYNKGIEVAGSLMQEKADKQKEIGERNTFYKMYQGLTDEICALKVDQLELITSEEPETQQQEGEANVG